MKGFFFLYPLQSGCFCAGIETPLSLIWYSGNEKRWEVIKKNMKEISVLKKRHHRELPLEAPLSRAGVLLVCPDTLWSNASKQPGWSTAALTFCLFLAFWFSLAPQKCIYGIKALLSPRGCCTSFWGPRCCCSGGQAVPCSACPSVKLVGEGDKKKGDTLLFMKSSKNTE